MGRILIVSRADKINEYKKIADEYDVGFELNDFYNPVVLEDKEELNQLIDFYQYTGLPVGSTMHGAFFDIVVFSFDSRIREISELRLEESMNTAVRLGVKGVVFHTNYSPMLSGPEYDKRAIEMTADFMECLLKRYPDTEIYLENMFDTDPEILAALSERLSVYDNYGVCFDYAHASISATPMKEWLEVLSPYIKHVHINDNDLKRDQHLAVGDGKINWEEFMQFKKQYFDESSILIETMLPENQRRSLEYLEKHFDGMITKRK